MQCSCHGIPEIVISGNGSQYASTEFARLASGWHSLHITSCPLHSKSNGKVESAAKICKGIMKKAVRGHYDPYLVLFDYRNTHAEVGSPLVQRLASRRTRNLSPLSGKQLEPETVHLQDVQQKFIGFLLQPKGYCTA